MLSKFLQLIWGIFALLSHEMASGQVFELCWFEQIRSGDFLLCDLVFLFCHIAIWDKAPTPPVIGPPKQSLSACFAHHVWRPSFILVTKFNAKITMVRTFYETCHWLPIRANGYRYSTFVAEHVRLISARYTIFWSKPSHSPAKQK